MANTIKIDRYDIIKYRKCIYLVKNFLKLEDGNYRLEYYFRSINNQIGKLKLNGFSDNSEYQFEYIKEASIEEIDLLVSKIRKEHPKFDLSSIKINSKENWLNLNEIDCIEYLKSKGYLVYKQM